MTCETVVNDQHFERPENLKPERPAIESEKQTWKTDLPQNSQCLAPTVAEEGSFQQGTATTKMHLVPRRYFFKEQDLGRLGMASRQHACIVAGWAIADLEGVGAPNITRDADSYQDRQPMQEHDRPSIEYELSQIEGVGPIGSTSDGEMHHCHPRLLRPSNNLTGYQLFVIQVRDSLSGEWPEVAKQLSKLWDVMDMEDKLDYENIA